MEGYKAKHSSFIQDIFFSNNWKHSECWEILLTNGETEAKEVKSRAKRHNERRSQKQ